jgi:hypothetical protein
VSTAIFTNAIYADKLLSIDLQLGSHRSDNVLRVARIFYALRQCTERLRLLYRTLGLQTPSGPRKEVIYPSPTADPPTADIPRLEFTAKLNRENGTPLSNITPNDEPYALYLAKDPTDPEADHRVLVKFTARYNERAHRLLAEHDPPLAPALHKCVRVVGGLFMVVMEHISASSSLPSFFDLAAPPCQVDAQVVRKALEEALELLHGNDFVFGDLRALNILYSHEGHRVFLVDFDWVGKHEEDRYSTCLNPGVNPRVVRWGIMKKSDDLESLKDVMAWLDEILRIRG